MSDAFVLFQIFVDVVIYKTQIHVKIITEFVLALDGYWLRIYCNVGPAKVGNWCSKGVENVDI